MHLDDITLAHADVPVETLLTQIAEEHVEAMALAIIQKLTEVCAQFKDDGIRSGNLTYLGMTYGIASRTADGDPAKGTYISMGLGAAHFDLGFLATPVAQFLRKRFLEASEAKPQTSYSSHDSMTGPIESRSDVFITPEGIFWCERTHSWFIRRRVN